jgi:hypothetical protein
LAACSGPAAPDATEDAPEGRTVAPALESIARRVEPKWRAVLIGPCRRFSLPRRQVAHEGNGVSPSEGLPLPGRVRGPALPQVMRSMLGPRSQWNRGVSMKAYVPSIAAIVRGSRQVPYVRPYAWAIGFLRARAVAIFVTPGEITRRGNQPRLCVLPSFRSVSGIARKQLSAQRRNQSQSLDGGKAGGGSGRAMSISPSSTA